MRFILLLIFFVIIPLSEVPVWASEAAQPFSESSSPIRPEAGEDLVYDIAFLWFERIAESRFSFEEVKETHGIYRATLTAQTLGVASWLTRDRLQRYISVMEKMPDGRLRALSHESEVFKGSGRSLEQSSKRYIFNYRDRQVIYQRIREGRLEKNEEFDFQEEAIPNDILTAFYNFRAGVFGTPAPGMVAVIPTFSHKEISEIIVEVLTEEERRNKFSFFPSDGLLCRVTVDPEVFDTGGGKVLVWFNEAGLPARAIVENVIGMGNVRGTLRTDESK